MNYKVKITVVDGKIVFSDGLREKFTQALQKIGNRENMELVIQDQRKDRSDRQRKYYYGVIIEKTRKHFGYDADDMDNVWCEHFLSYTIVDRNGSEKRLCKRASQLSTIETESFHESIRRYCATEEGLDIPLPNETEGMYDNFGE